MKVNDHLHAPVPWYPLDGRLNRVRFGRAVPCPYWESNICRPIRSLIPALTELFWSYPLYGSLVVSNVLFSGKILKAFEWSM